MFRGHSAGEPASITCDDEKDDLFCSTGPHGNLLYLKDKEKLERGFETNEVEWVGKVEFKKGDISGSRRSMHGNILTYPRL